MDARDSGAVPFGIVEIDHVVLRCRDQARALSFYTQLLGCTEERRIDAIGLIQLRAGQSMIDLVPLVPTEGSRMEEARNVDHICLGVRARDMGEVASYLRARQVEVIGEPATRYGARGMGTSIYIRDPEGNVIELKQTPAEA
jgi:catechol 2,3-dioxygenase-like lactoylglutathione lyase family enzyme